MATHRLFEISKQSTGGTLVKLVGAKDTTDSKERYITDELSSILAETQDVSVLDITSLNKLSVDIKELVPILLKFITTCKTGNIVQKKTVIVQDKLCCEIRGKVTGALCQKLKSVVGEIIPLDDLEASVRFSEVFNANYIASSVISDIQPPESERIRVLTNGLLAVDFSQIPWAERGPVVCACKKIISKIKQAKESVNNIQNVFCRNQSNEENKRKSSPESVTKESVKYKSKRSKSKKCYICKQLYSLPKKKKRDETSNTYPRLCKSCGELNLKKRTQKADMKGKNAVVTGGRIKIGYELILKMLRDGCSVITTTRFPHDAAKRYAQETDFEEWKPRLRIYALDMKDIPGVYKFVSYVKRTFSHLDILVNNAAQTIRRPMDFFKHLMDYECIPRGHIPLKQQEVLVEQDALNYGYDRQHLPRQPPSSTSSLPTVVELSNEESTCDEPAPKRSKTDEDIVQPTVELSTGQSCAQAGLDQKEGSSSVTFNRSISLDSHESTTCREYTNTNSFTPTSLCKHTDSAFSRDVIIHTGSAFSSMSRYFPRGATDADGQQLDLRRTNSWRMLLDDVPCTEIVEIFVVNVIAPFLLNKELKAMLCKSSAQRKFIVNVSAMEGQFNRHSKTKFHPHTNMGKAALNMMTRTAALGFKDKGIYMTSVDTGWITDERPFYMARHEQRVKGFQLPLDNVDGASRIYDPIIIGLTDTKTTPHYAVFLKDYVVHPW